MRAKLIVASLLGALLPMTALAAVPERLSAPVSRLEEGAPTLAPFAHVVFCAKKPDECRSDTQPNVERRLDDESWETLRRVNGEVNGAIRPAADRPGPLGDVWSLSPRKGDCEDYAITKRHRLVALGWPPSALRLLVARTPGGEGHAILLVKTDQGDLVLDNRSRQILPFNKSKLVFLKVQSGFDPKRWLDVSVGPAVADKR